MPIQGRKGKFRPLGYKGEPMNKREYDEWNKKRDILEGRSKPKKNKEKAVTPTLDARKRRKR